MKEIRGYFEKSITQVKNKIGEDAGGIFDEAPGLIEKKYSASSTALYDSLTELFAIVDEGNSPMNVPVYNGGLFITKPDPGGQYSRSPKRPIPS